MEDPEEVAFRAFMAGLDGRGNARGEGPVARHRHVNAANHVARLHNNAEIDERWRQLRERARVFQGNFPGLRNFFGFEENENPISRLSVEEYDAAMQEFIDTYQVNPEAATTQLQRRVGFNLFDGIPNVGPVNVPRNTTNYIDQENIKNNNALILLRGPNGYTHKFKEPGLTQWFITKQRQRGMLTNPKNPDLVVTQNMLSRGRARVANPNGNPTNLNELRRRRLAHFNKPKGGTRRKNKRRGSTRRH